jgi:hypothetical protein
VILPESGLANTTRICPGNIQTTRHEDTDKVASPLPTRLTTRPNQTTLTALCNQDSIMQIKTLLCATTCAIAALGPAITSAQTYPNKPIRMIVPFPPGGGVDFMARIIAQKLSERVGQQVIVDNRAGANGITGLQAMMAAPNDGYTIASASAGPLAFAVAARALVTFSNTAFSCLA